MFALFAYLKARLTDPGLWEKVGFTAVQAGGLAMTTLDLSDAIAVGGLSALVNLALLLLPSEQPVQLWARILVGAARTWISTFAGVALAATHTINASILQAAVFAATTAAIAAVKGAAGHLVGDPDSPAWLPAPADPDVETPPVSGDVQTADGKVLAAAKNAPPSARRRLRRLRQARQRRRAAKAARYGRIREPLQAQELFRLTNETRRSHGLPALHWHNGLAKVAQAHAEDQDHTGVLSHSSSDGTVWWKRVEHVVGTDWDRLEENTGGRFSSPAAEHDAFMRSPEHEVNILNPTVTDLGIGYSGGYYVEDFGRP